MRSDMIEQRFSRYVSYIMLARFQLWVLKSLYTHTHTLLMSETISCGKCTLRKVLEEKTKELWPMQGECSDFK